MSPADADFWSARVERTLQRYDEALLRSVSDELFRPRSQWPVDELIQRCLGVVGNVAVVDRRLQTVGPQCRRVLAFMAHSGQPCWRVGSLIELLAAVDASSADARPLLTLCSAGLLYPVLPDAPTKIKSFESWLGASSGGGPHEVFAHPLVVARASGEDLGLPKTLDAVEVAGTEHEADGLEWPLRLGIVWQQTRAASLRRTQQGDFFKRDLDRLRNDPLLTSPPADSLTEVPDAGLLAAELALIEGILEESSGELKAVANPPGWDGLHAVLQALWSNVPRLETWTPQDGWRGKTDNGGNPYPSASLLALLLLAQSSGDRWISVDTVARWVVEHHPFWTGSADRAGRQRGLGGITTFLLGLAFQLRMIQAARHGDKGWAVRLSPTGRWLLGLGPLPAAPPSYPQTILVQPNLEIVAYRQGLNPALIARLGQFATWKNLGSACSLQLEPESVYRALESGQTFDVIRQTLDQYGMRPTPVAVIEALRTWSNKRERLCVYPAATLLEFATPDDLNEALARGTPAIRLSDCLAVVANGDNIDFSHFKLAGTRDYGLPPEKCVEVEPDGVTLNVDMARSDLLLETEVRRFAEPVRRAVTNGRRQYRITPATLAASRRSGLTDHSLDEWFQQRAGRSLSPAARLLMTSTQIAPLELRRQLVLYTESEETAAGLLQWPETRALIEQRLGLTSLLVAEENVEPLRQRLAELGMSFRE